jgi:hypothetical protein
MRSAEFTFVSRDDLKPANHEMRQVRP